MWVVLSAAALAAPPYEIYNLAQAHLNSIGTVSASTTVAEAPTITISGTLSYCTNPDSPPVPNVTLILTGSVTATTSSDGSGNYTFTVPSGGSYTVTPSKAPVIPGSPGIDTVDVLAIIFHLLHTPCQIVAADVNGDGMINTVDVISVQRFLFAKSTGIANTGRYHFNPPNRTYHTVVTNQTGQNYDTLVFGDVVAPFLYGPEGPSQPAVSDNTILSPVTTVALPQIAPDHPGTDFTAPVTTSTIDAKKNLVGFQGDFTFDERIITFQSEPVQKAGLTAGNWNVSGNVLDGPGPLRTLRVSAYSNDFVPLSGSGTLFELRIERVNPAGQTTQLLWAPPPTDFIFIDADLNVQKPNYAASGSIGAKHSD